MKYIFILIIFILIGCSHPIKTHVKKELKAPSLEPIADNVWIHKSYENIAPYGPVLSQGLVVVKNGHAIIIDSAWNNHDTVEILNLTKKLTGATTDIAILTHAHNDKMGGVSTFKRNGVDTLALDKTNEDAIKNGLEPAERTLTSPFRNGQIFINKTKNITTLLSGPKVEIFYPGPGHTRDNIVVYVPDAKVLFAGCFIRPGKTKSLGNIADANIAEWAQSIEATATRFPNAEIIIPSHGTAGGRDLFDHTITLIKNHAQR